MVVGHAAGVAAVTAVASNKPVQEIDVRAFAAKLVSQGAARQCVPSPKVRAINLFYQICCGPRKLVHGMTSGATERCP